MPTVWDQFSDPVPASWDDFSDPVEVEPVKASIEPTRGKYISRADRKQQFFMENPRPSSMFDMNPSGSTDMAQALGGVAETGAQLASGSVAMPVSGLAGMATVPFAGMEKADEITRRIQDLFTYQPRTAAGQQASSVVSYPFEKIAQAGDKAGDFVSRSTGSPALGAATNTLAQSLPAVVLHRGIRTNGRPVPDRPGSAAVQGEAARIPAPAKAGRDAGLERVSEAPTIEELTAAKNAAYKAADNSGVVVSRAAMNRLKVELVNDLKKEGINRKLHPKASAAVEEIINTKGQLTLSQIETLRKIANDAKGAIEPADARLGARIVEKIDDFEGSLAEGDVVGGSAEAATAYKEARALNTKLAKSKTIQKLFDDAELQAGANYTVSGMENALRQQFKALAKNDRKMRGFTAEEKSAIRKVALGGPLENTLRLLGKFAPNGTVPSLVGLGAVAYGGPTGFIVPAAGAAGRYAATKMTMRNAKNVQDMVRFGPRQNNLPIPSKLRNVPLEQ